MCDITESADYSFFLCVRFYAVSKFDDVVMDSFVLYPKKKVSAMQVKIYRCSRNIINVRTKQSILSFPLAKVLRCGVHIIHESYCNQCDRTVASSIFDTFDVKACHPMVATVMARPKSKHLIWRTWIMNENNIVL